MAPVASEDGLLLFVYQGNSYQIRAGDLLSVAGVPTTRNVNAGTGLTGGGQLAADITLSVAVGGIGSAQLAASGVTAGTYGSSTTVPVFTVDATGRVMSITNVAVAVSGYVPESRQVIAGTGLSGGGTLNNNVTLLANLSSATPASGYQVGTSGVATDITRSDHRHPAVNLAIDDEVDGLLGLSNGGTGRSLVTSAGAIIWCGADGLYVGVTGGAGQVLVSGGASAPTWGSAMIISDQPANVVYAGPASGPDAPTAFRALVTADLPVGTGTVTSVAALTLGTTGTDLTSTVANGSTTPVITLNVPTASATNRGALSTTDWSAFNGKQDAFGNQLANVVYAGPVGASGPPSFRALVTSDIPSLSSLYLPLTGGTLSGQLSLPASTSSLIPLHLAQGATPTTPVDGDIWFDQNGVYIKNLSAIHQMDADANSTGPLSKVSITDNGDGTINVSAIEVFIYAEAGWQGNYMRRTAPAATNLTLVSGANYLTVIYNSGVPIYQVTQNVSSINNSNVLLIANMWLDGTQIHYVVVNWGLATANRLNDRLINVQRYVRTSGLMLGETATPTTRTITATSGLLWYGITAVSESAVDSSSSNCDFYYHVAGVWTKSPVSVYNNTQYDNGTSLVTLSGVGTQYAVNWVYRYIDGAALPKLAYVLGSGNYSLTQAQASTVPTPPPILTAQAILIGRIIVAQNATTATQIDSTFTTVFAGSTVTDHNSLAGLQGGITDEYYHLTSAEYIGTGSGDFVRATSPTLTTPVLGTPASGNFSTGTFTWPTFNQDTTGKSAKTDALNSATTAVNVSSATAPTAGQILTATSGTAATWQGISGGTF